MVGSHEVVIIGAGPYGLALAAHLREAGITPRLFGEPMAFWQQRMPKGMYLRSSWDASHISDPRGHLTLDAYEQAHHTRIPRPVPLAQFIAYGHWVQQHVAPALDRRRVTSVQAIGDGLRLRLSDGELLEAPRVVIATGLDSFGWRPPQFDQLPQASVSHSSDHPDLGQLSGRRVIVIGGGQSAIESAAILHEGGAEVEVIVRAPQVRWLRRSAWLHNHFAPIRYLLYPPTDVGPPGLNWIVGLPDVFRRLPPSLQPHVASRSIRPAAAGWLAPRVGNVKFTTGQTVTRAESNGKGLRIVLDDGTERRADHVLLATGYRVDVRRLLLLAPEIVQALRCIDGYPVLDSGFQSSVPGLHFIGAPAARSFGPLMRFVSGTYYTARAVTAQIRAYPP